ncbi:MAG: DUF4233 domain-containing protein [Nocardioidaceae bacterium]|nr:DUF4233 domain-containing protein [Nocardioidaceae bacterium]
MRAVCAAVLCLEAIVLGLTAPVMIAVAEVRLWPALVGGVGLALVALFTAGLLRHSWAYLVGHLVQAGALALGFVVPVMFALGAIFTALWVAALVLGHRVEAVKATRGGAAGAASAR